MYRNELSSRNEQKSHLILKTLVYCSKFSSVASFLLMQAAPPPPPGHALYHKEIVGLLMTMLIYLASAFL